MDKIAQGNACFVDEDYTEAIKYYTQCINEAPDDERIVADAYVKRSAARLKLEHFTDAFDDAQSALVRQPQLRFAAFRKARAAFALEKFDVATHAFTQAAACSDDASDVWRKKLRTWIRKCDAELEGRTTLSP